MGAVVTVFDLERGWAAQGVCRPEDDHLFYAGGDGHSAVRPKTLRSWTQAKEICAMCPVLQQCREATRGEIYGVWGGLDPHERMLARRRFAKEVERWPESQRLDWGKALAELRDAGMRWSDIQAQTGVPEQTAERLIRQWREHRPAERPEVVDLALPEPGHRRELPFPDRLGERHLWARHNGMVTDCWYRGQTADGEWVYVETWAGQGRSVKKWIPTEDVQVYSPQPVTIKNYAGRPRAA